ncbi:MAG: hypothetical protein AAGH60_10585 [Pseudomonadota bacterium]
MFGTRWSSIKLPATLLAICAVIAFQTAVFVFSAVPSFAHEAGLSLCDSAGLDPAHEREHGDYPALNACDCVLKAGTALKPSDEALDAPVVDHLLTKSAAQEDVEPVRSVSAVFVRGPPTPFA